MQNFTDISMIQVLKLSKNILALSVINVLSIEPIISRKYDNFGKSERMDYDLKTPAKVSQSPTISVTVLINIHMLGIKLHQFSRGFEWNC